MVCCTIVYTEAVSFRNNDNVNDDEFATEETSKESKLDNVVGPVVFNSNSVYKTKYDGSVKSSPTHKKRHYRRFKFNQIQKRRKAPSSDWKNTKNMDTILDGPYEGKEHRYHHLLEFIDRGDFLRRKRKNKGKHYATNSYKKATTKRKFGNETYKETSKKLNFTTTRPSITKFVVHKSNGTKKRLHKYKVVNSNDKVIGLTTKRISGSIGTSKQPKIYSKKVKHSHELTQDYSNELYEDKQNDVEELSLETTPLGIRDLKGKQGIFKLKMLQQHISDQKQSDKPFEEKNNKLEDKFRYKTYPNNYLDFPNENDLITDNVITENVLTNNVITDDVISDDIITDNVINENLEKNGIDSTNLNELCPSDPNTQILHEQMLLQPLDIKSTETSSEKNSDTTSITSSPNTQSLNKNDFKVNNICHPTKKAPAMDTDVDFINDIGANLNNPETTRYKYAKATKFTTVSSLNTKNATTKKNGYVFFKNMDKIKQTNDNLSNSSKSSSTNAYSSKNFTKSGKKSSAKENKSTKKVNITNQTATPSKKVQKSTASWSPMISLDSNSDKKNDKIQASTKRSVLPSDMFRVMDDTSSLIPNDEGCTVLIHQPHQDETLIHKEFHVNPIDGNRDVPKKFFQSKSGMQLQKLDDHQLKNVGMVYPHLNGKMHSVRILNLDKTTRIPISPIDATVRSTLIRNKLKPTFKGRISKIDNDKMFFGNDGQLEVYSKNLYFSNSDEAGGTTSSDDSNSASAENSTESSTSSESHDKDSTTSSTSSENHDSGDHKTVHEESKDTHNDLPASLLNTSCLVFISTDQSMLDQLKEQYTKMPNVVVGSINKVTLNATASHDDKVIKYKNKNEDNKKDNKQNIKGSVLSKNNKLMQEMKHSTNKKSKPFMLSSTPKTVFIQNKTKLGNKYEDVENILSNVPEEKKTGSDENKVGTSKLKNVTSSVIKTGKVEDSSSEPSEIGESKTQQMICETICHPVSMNDATSSQVGLTNPEIYESSESQANEEDKQGDGQEENQAGNQEDNQNVNQDENQEDNQTNNFQTTLISSEVMPNKDDLEENKSNENMAIRLNQPMPTSVCFSLPNSSGGLRISPDNQIITTQNQLIPENNEIEENLGECVNNTEGSIKDLITDTVENVKLPPITESNLKFGHSFLVDDEDNEENVNDENVKLIPSKINENRDAPLIELKLELGPQSLNTDGLLFSNPSIEDDLINEKGPIITVNGQSNLIPFNHLFLTQQHLTDRSVKSANLDNEHVPTGIEKKLSKGDVLNAACQIVVDSPNSLKIIGPSDLTNYKLSELHINTIRPKGSLKHNFNQSTEKVVEITEKPQIQKFSQSPYEIDPSNYNPFININSNTSIIQVNITTPLTDSQLNDLSPIIQSEYGNNDKNFPTLSPQNIDVIANTVAHSVSDVLQEMFGCNTGEMAITPRIEGNVFSKSNSNPNVNVKVIDTDNDRKEFDAFSKQYEHNLNKTDKNDHVKINSGYKKQSNSSVNVNNSSLVQKNPEILTFSKNNANKSLVDLNNYNSCDLLKNCSNVNLVDVMRNVKTRKPFNYLDVTNPPNYNFNFQKNDDLNGFNKQEIIYVPKENKYSNAKPSEIIMHPENYKPMKIVYPANPAKPPVPVSSFLNSGEVVKINKTEPVPSDIESLYANQISKNLDDLKINSYQDSLTQNFMPYTESNLRRSSYIGEYENNFELPTESNEYRENIEPNAYTIAREICIPDDSHIDSFSIGLGKNFDNKVVDFTSESTKMQTTNMDLQLIPNDENEVDDFFRLRYPQNLANFVNGEIYKGGDSRVKKVPNLNLTQDQLNYFIPKRRYHSNKLIQENNLIDKLSKSHNSKFLKVDNVNDHNINVDDQEDEDDSSYDELTDSNSTKKVKNTKKKELKHLNHQEKQPSI
nr:putative uncharacterized protein DDB_G0282133 [Onthophagus taurus]